jgi:hypothetical protein
MGIRVTAHDLRVAASRRLVHYSTTSGLTHLDPSYMGTGRLSIREQQDMRVPTTFYYTEGSKPEALIVGAAKARYEAELPPDAELIDLSVRPPWAQEALQEDGRGGMLQAVKDKGYFGYHNSASTLSHAVVVFYTLPVVETALYPEGVRDIEAAVNARTAMLTDEEVEDALIGPLEEDLI